MVVVEEEVVEVCDGDWIDGNEFPHPLGNMFLSCKYTEIDEFRIGNLFLQSIK